MRKVSMPVTEIPPTYTVKYKKQDSDSTYDMLSYGLKGKCAGGINT